MLELSTQRQVVATPPWTGGEVVRASVVLQHSDEHRLVGGHRHACDWKVQYEGYRRVLTIRNPFTRLVSAWRWLRNCEWPEWGEVPQLSRFLHPEAKPHLLPEKGQKSEVSLTFSQGKIFKRIWELARENSFSSWLDKGKAACSFRFCQWSQLYFVDSLKPTNFIRYENPVEDCLMARVKFRENHNLQELVWNDPFWWRHYTPDSVDYATRVCAEDFEVLQDYYSTDFRDALPADLTRSDKKRIKQMLAQLDFGNVPKK